MTKGFTPVPRDAGGAPGIVAIIRTRAASPPDLLVQSLVDGGVRTIEVTLPTPGATAAVRRWRERGDVTVGIGTVRTRRDAELAVDAGAQFLVSPTVNEAVLAFSHDVQIPVMCGAATPSEIDRAWAGGARVVKVFPIDCLGGERYVRALVGPMPEIPLLPTGGVDAEGTERYAALGCAGVGIGSALVEESMVVRQDWPGITRRAAQLTEAWRRGAVLG